MKTKWRALSHDEDALYQVFGDQCSSIAMQVLRAGMKGARAREARDEGFDEIADWFETLAKAERSHANKFQKTLDTMDD